MQTKVSFLARVPDGKGNFPFVPVQCKKGQPIPVPGATSFYLRFRESGKRVMLPVGDDLTKAFLAYANRMLNGEHAKLGLPVAVASVRRSILSCLQQYVDELDKLGRPRKSVLSYRHAVENLCRSTSKTDMEQLDRADIINYISWMRHNLGKHKINGRLDGERNGTIINRLRYLRAFLRRFEVKMPFAEKDWPKVSRKNPDRYQLNGHIDKLLKVATEDEKDLIHFLLCTGFRDEEAAHAFYTDIRRGKINVYEKPEYNFKIKDHEQRPIDIPLPGWFQARLNARRARYPKTKLIFPLDTDATRPCHNLLGRIKKVAKRAGLDCNATLHKFRRTFGTLMAKQFGVRQAQAMLGHSKIETTMAYLAADEMDTAEAQKGIEDVFAPVGD